MIHISASPSAAGLPVSKPNRRGDDSSWWGGGNSQVIRENSWDFAKIWKMLSYLMGSMRPNKNTFCANPACHKMLIWTWFTTYLCFVMPWILTLHSLAGESRQHFGGEAGGQPGWQEGEKTWTTWGAFGWSCLVTRSCSGTITMLMFHLGTWPKIEPL